MALYIEAIRAALRDALLEDERVFLLGEDIGHFGGAFGVTKGLWEEFGDERVIDTPIAEEAFVGAAVGAAWMGDRPVAELQFADFASCAFDPIVTVAAKTHWRSGIRLPLVIRAPFGGGVSGGPFHSQCPEGWFVGVAGLKVVCPASVEDAYGLLRAAIDDDDPVLYFEHKALYRRLSGSWGGGDARTPIGRAAVARAGSAATVVTYGAGVELALHATEGLDVEVLDLRSLKPLDEGALLASAAKTGRVVVVQEAPRTVGFAAEVAAILAEKAIYDLRGPVLRVTGYDVPYPYWQLEDAYMPSVERVVDAVRRLLAS